ncbi:MAG: hypothetical protein AVDCRST_MAG45-926, partial [uncultured Solirubrobacterales bacterium]
VSGRHQGAHRGGGSALRGGRAGAQAAQARLPPRAPRSGRRPDLARGAAGADGVQGSGRRRTGRRRDPARVLQRTRTRRAPGRLGRGLRARARARLRRPADHPPRRQGGRASTRARALAL